MIQQHLIRRELQKHLLVLQQQFLAKQLSLVAMLGAAFGYLTPSQSAIVQEFIDAAAIGFALLGSKVTGRS